jgi:hypothetical protein
MRARRFRPILEQLSTRIVLDASTAGAVYYPGDEIDPGTIMSQDSSSNTPTSTDSSGDDGDDPMVPAVVLVPSMPYSS